VDAADFNPVFSVRDGTRWGIVPGKAKEYSLGLVDKVSLRESLRIYRAALWRTEVAFEDRVVCQHQDGRTEVYNWDGDSI
jgi:hypothetical protein